MGRREARGQLAYPRMLQVSLSREAPTLGLEVPPATPLTLRSLHWAVGVEAGWGEGSGRVRMPSQLSLGHL